MPMCVELRAGDGRQIGQLPDPSAGTFDTTGDFDRFFDETYLADSTSWGYRYWELWTRTPPRT